jgi:hypothetical protein
MGITYQTQNRLRRKVMTAPLTAPAQTAPVEPVVIEPVRAPIKGFLWPITAAGAVAIAAFFATKAL